MTVSLPAYGQQVPKTAEKAAAPKPAVEKPGDDEKAKKAQKPARQVTRKEYVELPGAPRMPLEGFFRGRTKAIPFEAPTTEQIDAVRRGSEDRQAIDAVAKALVYALTNPNDELNMGKNVEEAMKPAAKGKTGFVQIYKAAAIKYAKDLLNNSLAAQINAVLLINRLMDGNNDVKDGVPVLVQILQDDKREDAVLYLALRGLQIAKQHKLLDVKPEREAVVAILSIAKRPGVQPVLFEEIVVTLGEIGMAYTGDLPERADIAVFLANLSLDSTQSLRMRFLATHGLGNVNPSPVTRVNWELAGFILGRFVNDLATAHKENKIPEETYRFWLYNLAVDFKNLNRASGNPRFKELADAVRAFAAAVIDKQEADAGPIAAWLNVPPPKDLRLAPSAEPVKFPGAPGK